MTWLRTGGRSSFNEDRSGKSLGRVGVRIGVGRGVENTLVRVAAFAASIEVERLMKVKGVEAEEDGDFFVTAVGDLLS
ncbi:hypothetical protein ACLOJK_007778 [Asimina triloba]